MPAEAADDLGSAVDSGSVLDGGRRDVLWKAGSKDGDDDGVDGNFEDAESSALFSFMDARKSLNSASAISSRLIGRRLLVEREASSACLGDGEVPLVAIS